jgi:proline iminopeptidase
MNAIMPDLTPLHSQRTVIYFDQRGGGRSELPIDTTSLSKENFVEDLEAVRQHFGLSRMDVLAHSFGAIILAEYALRYPEHLGRIVLLGATAPVRADAGGYAQTKYEEADPALLDSLFRPLSGLLNGTSADPVASCHAYREAGRRLAQAEGRLAFGDGSECDMPPEAVSYYFRYTARLGPQSFGDWNYADMPSNVSSPLLVVFGDRDSLALSMQRDWAAAFENGRLLVLSNAGKAVHVERPELVFPAINTFLHGRWPDSAVTVSTRPE